MFISTLSTLTLGAALLSGASAMAITPRAIVGPQINCNSMEDNAPYLTLAGFDPGFNSTYMLSDALKAAGSSTVPATDSQVLQNLTPFSGDYFQFRICNSSYMGYPHSSTTNGVKSFFGHLQPSNQDTCVTRTTTDGHTFLVNAPCRYNDDSGQEAQYFQLATVIEDVFAEEVTFNVTLLGAPKGQKGSKYYFTPGTNAAPAVTVSTKANKNQLQLQYIHIN